MIQGQKIIPFMDAGSKGGLQWFRKVCIQNNSAYAPSLLGTPLPDALVSSSHPLSREGSTIQANPSIKIGVS